MSKSKRFLAAAGVATIGVVGMVPLVVPVSATPPSPGVSVKVLARAQFGEIRGKAQYGLWKAEIETEEPSDFHVIEVTIPPLGTIGWHSHAGPSFVVVKSGTATLYDAADAKCTRHVIKADSGLGLFEPGGHVHIVRNEDPNETLVNVVVHLLPAGAARLISEPDPGNCAF